MSYPATKTRSFAAGVGATSLDTITGLPPYAPCRLTLVPVAGGSCSFTHEDTSTIAVTTAANGAPIILNGPIRAIVTNTGTIVIAEWWGAPSGIEVDPQYSIASNP